MYKPKLSCRRIIGSGGHDAHDARYDTIRFRSSPPMDASVAVEARSLVHHYPQVSRSAQLSHRRINPRYHHQTLPGNRSIVLKTLYVTK